MNKNWMMIAMLTAAVGVGCKETKTKKAATTKAPKTVQNTTPTPNPQAMTKIVVADRSGTSFTVNPKDLVSLKFALQNLNGSYQWQWGLTSSPEGSRLLNRTNQSADYSWKATVPGTYNVTVLARDMARCQELNQSNAQVCFISDQVVASVRADSRYDITQRFTITVRQPATVGGGYTNPNGNSGPDDSVGLFGRIGQMGRNIFGFFGSMLGS